MADEATLKVQRRTAKGKLTRTQNAVQFLLKAKRPSSEVKDSFTECKAAFEDVCKKHEDYTSVIAEEDEFEKQEKWIDECQQAFLELKVQVNDYCNDTVDLERPEESRGSEPAGETLQARDETASNVPKEHIEAELTPTLGHSDVRSASFSNFKMEKPKMPKFSGDVRDYHVFKSDFVHAIGTGYSKRDAISLLRACLQGKPAEMVRGIGSDYEAAWEYLDSVYGDPRFIADAIINDLNKFKSLKDGDDSRFCELIHLIRRSFNTLKEIGRPQDMDNSQMLALIERKLNGDDKKVWFRYLETENKPATLAMLIDWLTIEMKSRMRATAPVRCDSSKSGYSVYYAGNGNYEAAKPFHKCWICETSTHWVDECKKLMAMSYSQRMDKIKDNHACFCCLKKAGKSHRMANCKRRKQCTEMVDGNQCTYFHHPLLHKPQESVAGTVGIALNENAKAILPIVQTKMVGPRGREQTGNVLFDSGAEISLIRSSVAESLNLKGQHVNVTITKLGGEQEQIQTKRFQLQIKSLETNRLYQIRAIGLPTISEEIEKIQLDIVKGLKLNHSDLKRGSGPLDLLIGIDFPHMHSGEMKQSENLVARHSPLGWVVFGSCQGQTTYQKGVLYVKVSTPIDMTDFWSTESMGDQAQNCQCEPTRLSKREQDEAKIISESCQKIGKQWLVPYPWCKDPHLLPDNRVQVERTLLTTERRLQKNPVCAEAYNDQIREMVNMKFAKKLSRKEQESYMGPVHYISHHAVLRPDKKSTPVRIVFNASSSFSGHCLNDYWLKGPDLLNNLFGILLRFRQYEVAACGDISKMYHRVLIPTIDQHIHRFLWRDLETDRPPDVYMKTVLTFGDKPAPAMAQIALLKTAEEGAAKYPEAAQMLKKNTYMDDICFSTPTPSEMAEVTKGIDEVLAEGGFNVKGWRSNCLLSETHNKKKDEVKPLLNHDSAEKVLGVVWNEKDDTLSYKVCLRQDMVKTEGETSNPEKFTKRKIMSKVAHIFDPIGFASAVVVRAKIGLQKLWQQGLDWDTELQEEDQLSWYQLFKETDNLNSITFERCLMPPVAKGLPVLCIFSDASEHAFGTCAYLRWPSGNDDKFQVRFVTAKSRVAPLKQLTIPRLELQAAVLAARLGQTVTEELTMSLEKVIYLTDSMITLSWIKSQARSYKPFVSARVGEIQSLTDPAQWFHIPGELNVADELSRGIPVEKLMGRWKQGPEFLSWPEDKWPLSKFEPNQSSDTEKRKGQKIILVTTAQVLDCSRISDWGKLLRVTAYVFRFMRKLKAKSSKQNGCECAGHSVTPAELEESQTYWIQEAQKNLLDGFDSGKFKSLSPFVKDGTIRVGGRLKEDLMSYDTAHPVLLPQMHPVSLLITRHYHNMGHNGVACTTAKVRKKYWIIGAQRLAKSVKYKCVTCRKTDHRIETQRMADLPKERMAPYTPPFYFTSCDYFGPMTVKVGRNKTTKHYGVVFTCLNTRAVHLDLAVDCSSMEFLQVLRRFFAVRGQPAHLLSDNGSQFVGAEKELRLMLKGWNQQELQEFCAGRGTEWKFTTPAAPHQNGCAESLVKSCKIALKKAIGDQLLTPMELYTCLQEVGNLINQRPIGRVPNDPDDGGYLCPNDMLLGRASREVPQGPFRETPNPKHRFEFVQKIVNSFWQRWTRDVLPLLVPRRKWDANRRNVCVNDIVMLVDSSAVRGKWTIGRVVEVYPGSDGKVRNVKVKTRTADYRRPIGKIAVIYPAEGYED